MSTAELKNYLHQLIVETNDETILSQVQEYFKALKNNIPSSHMKEVLERKRAIKAGEIDLEDWDSVRNELLS